MPSGRGSRNTPPRPAGGECSHPRIAGITGQPLRPAWGRVLSSPRAGAGPARADPRESARTGSGGSERAGPGPAAGSEGAVAPGAGPEPLHPGADLGERAQAVLELDRHRLGLPEALLLERRQAVLAQAEL